MNGEVMFGYQGLREPADVWWCLGIVKEVAESDTGSLDSDTGEAMVVEWCLGAMGVCKQ